MPKLYDFKKAKELIDVEVDNADVDKVFLGTLSDYFWTAETVWEKGEYIIDLGKVKTIAGIPGSDWDTPIINIYYSDGKEKKFECFKEVTSDEFADFCRKLQKMPNRLPTIKAHTKIILEKLYHRNEVL
ncbi:hypothetical protein NGH81_06655 [Enterococcus faecalis]|uniref:hypothetical protein n=1 Tax=Enterococcus faecalis TaxID=1351 RepID=UPI002DBB0853|nr:hypothetical protein [Enterococcus faecalis]MEB7968788.1 hypothetical protein [Enterococcus faecalis]